MRKTLAAFALMALAVFAGSPARAAPDPGVTIAFAGPPVAVFSAPRDACDGDDVPDAPPRAFHLAQGGVRLFGLHTKNRSLTGPDLHHLHIDCAPALVSHANPDPAAYDDESWIAATWTADGRIVDGLVHHEYQGSEHPGRCRFPTYMQCWFNTVLAVRSIDAGARFVKTPKPVVASAPFPQTVDQGRHRGFFNPSNIVSDGHFTYFLASTTGWDGQPNGVCLFRTATPDDPASWRAYDGAGFSIRYVDPYRVTNARPAPCRPIAPFPAPVGSLVRQRQSGLWLAVFQASANATLFPVSGFYAATSRDLIAWSDPRLVLPGETLYDDPCGAGGRLIAYPTLLDEADPSRNFDASGAHPDLFYTVIETEGCTITSRRSLLRRALTVR